MAEECDYMSDEFLTACGSADIRPGLVHSRVKQREYNAEKKKERNKEEQKKSNTKFLASERLNEGLENPIGPENKGFSMLQKMGFKPGSSLGTKKTGILEPIAISIKNDRKGLGREQAIRDIQLRKQFYRERRSKQTSLNVESYRASLSKKYRERDIMSDLLKSEKACYKLDTEGGIKLPAEPWFWPRHCLPNEEDADSDEEDDAEDAEYGPAEKLEMLTLYLRQSHLYCIWCGVKYDDEKDFSSSCPGSTREEH